MYNLKKVQNTNGELFVTISDADVRPMEYATRVYGLSRRSFDENLYTLLCGIAEGDVYPLPQCMYENIDMNDVSSCMYTLQKGARHVGVSNDYRYGTTCKKELDKLIANRALRWLKNKRIAITEEDKTMVRNFDAYAERKYSYLQHDFEQKRIVLVASAVWSSLFPDYDSFYGNDGRMFLGLRKNYDNHGHYNNADDSAIYLTEFGNDDDAYTLFEFFGNGVFLENVKKPDVDWSLLSEIPGMEAARKLYETL